MTMSKLKAAMKKMKLKNYLKKTENDCDSDDDGSITSDDVDLLEDDYLGNVIENKKFSQILINQLKKFNKTKVYYGFKLIDIKLNDINSRVFSNNTIINAKIRPTIDPPII